MSVGVRRALAWRPGELVAVARCWEEKAREIDDMAVVVRDEVDRGTDGQRGEFIDRVRRDGETIMKNAIDAADLLLAGAAVLRRVEPDIVMAVATLGRVVDEARDLDLTVNDDGTVHGSRPAVGADASGAVAREARRAELQSDAVGALRALAEADERTDRELHGVVGREVRDRTWEGNWDPSSAYGSGAISSLTGLFGTTYEASEVAGDIPTSPRWWNQARNFGLFGNVLGFVGGVASAPEDEPWYETLTAEGVGAIAGSVGSVAGGPFASKLTKFFKLDELSPAVALAGDVGGGMIAALGASGAVRQEFDNAN